MTKAASSGPSLRSVDAAIRVLLEGLIDYAGLFPPAGLAMGECVRKHASNIHGQDRWMLGRLIVPARQLGELEAILVDYETRDNWRLSALVGTDAIPDLQEIDRFNKRQARNGVVVDTIELAPQSLERVPPSISQSFQVYLEVPGSIPSHDLERMQRTGIRAKIRTGGLVPEAIPSTQMLARFLENCNAAGMAFKATAGLHHPLRSLRPLTYEVTAPVARMHGFLNVFLAAVVAARGASAEEIQELLEFESGADVRLAPGELRFGKARASVETIRSSRRLFAISFGSCSFDEPVADLEGLGLL